MTRLQLSVMRTVEASIDVERVSFDHHYDGPIHVVSRKDALALLESHTERARNYELEESLREATGNKHRFVISCWCPYNAIFCNWINHVPMSELEVLLADTPDTARFGVERSTLVNAIDRRKKQKADAIAEPPVAGPPVPVESTKLTRTEDGKFRVTLPSGTVFDLETGHFDDFVDDLRHQADKLADETEPIDRMLRMPGEQRSFRCMTHDPTRPDGGVCNGNVFRASRLNPKRFKCNSCGAWYVTEAD